MSKIGVNALKFKIFSELKSTHQHANKRIRNGKGVHGECVIALRQTAGRGQYGRSWFDSGGNLMMSMMLLPHQKLDEDSLFWNKTSSFASCNNKQDKFLHTNSMVSQLSYITAISAGDIIIECIESEIEKLQKSSNITTNNYINNFSTNNTINNDNGNLNEIPYSLNRSEFDIKYKWVNDLMIAETEFSAQNTTYPSNRRNTATSKSFNKYKKFGGLLHEIIEHDGQIWVIVSLGINLASAPDIKIMSPDAQFKENFEDKKRPESYLDGSSSYFGATSLYNFGVALNPQELARKIMKKWVHYHNIWLEHGFHKIRSKWLQYALYIGEDIMIKHPKGWDYGVFVGLDDDGNIIVDSFVDKELKSYSSGSILPYVS